MVDDSRGIVAARATISRHTAAREWEVGGSCVKLELFDGALKRCSITCLQAGSDTTPDCPTVT